MDKTAVELFAGVGGFRCGLNNVELIDGKTIENGDWSFVWANQWEPSTKTQDAFNCYVKRFGKSDNHSNVDINLVNKNQIPNHTLLCGGFPCLTAESLILTTEGYKKIVDVKVGDEVVTHTGKTHKVLNFFNQGKKETFKLESSGGTTLTLTENHRLLVRKKKERDKIIASNFNKADYMTVEEMLVIQNNSSVSDVLFLGSPINQNSQLPELPKYKTDFNRTHIWYLVGSYLANEKVQPDREDKNIKKFLNLFGKRNKHLPGFVYDLPVDFIKIILNEYSKRANNSSYLKSNRAKMVTPSEEMALGFAQLLQKIYRFPCRIKKQLIEDKEQFAIFCGDNKNYGFYDDNYIWYPILKIEKNKIEKVYDIEVETTHSFLVGNCISHNCQDYSVAHSLSSEKGIEGKKGVLWWQIAEILEIKQPPFVLLENVDRLLISPAKQRGRDFAIMLRTFFDKGYGVEWQVINAADYGMPQKRKRIFIFAYKNSTKYFNAFDNPKEVIKNGIFTNTFKIKGIETEKEIDLTTYRDVVEVSDKFKEPFLTLGCMKNGKVYTAKYIAEKQDLFMLKDILVKEPVDEKYFLTDTEIEKFKYLKGTKRIPRTKPNGEPYMYTEGQMPFPENLEVPARTMLTSERTVNRSSHVVEDYITKRPRYLLPIEAERINCFPDNWTDSGMNEKKRYFMMGNALVVGIIKRLEKPISKIIEGENNV